MGIIDRRQDNKYNGDASRKQFIDRFRGHLKKRVDDLVKDAKIKDLVGKDKQKVKVPEDMTSIPSWGYASGTGDHGFVRSGNDKYETGDVFHVRKRGGSMGGGAGNGGDQKDDFEFLLSQQEFLDLYFENLELPNFIKKGMKKIYHQVRQRAGFCKRNIPVHLDVRKTFLEKTKRKIIWTGLREERLAQLEVKLLTLPEGKERDMCLHEIEQLKKRKGSYLRETDLRFRKFTLKKKPINHAVVFCVMDVSGSLQEREKSIAKHFYVLFCMFLNKLYESLEIRFIRHHHEARLVDEEEFFHGRDSGGTTISTAFTLVNDIIDNEYDVAHTNIYVAYAGDGENNPEDNKIVFNLLRNTLIPKLQFFAYLQVMPEYNMMRLSLANFHNQVKRFKELYPEKVGSTFASDQSQVYRVFQDLFKKGNEKYV